MPRRPAIWPIPLEPLYDSPEFAKLPAAGAGMVLRLVMHWWQIGLAPLPTAEAELRSIARAHPATWREHKAGVLRALSQLEPALREYRARREAGHKAFGLAAWKSAQASKARVASSALAQSPPEAAPPFASGALPQREPKAQRRAVRQLRTTTQQTLAD